MTEAAPRNGTLFVVLGILLVIFVAIGLVAGRVSEELMKPLPQSESARALIISTSDTSRTVVVAPCATPLADTERDAANGVRTPAATILTLPQGPTDRAVLVPNCNPMTKAENAVGDLPSAAFVLPVGTKNSDQMMPPLKSLLRIIVPNGSTAKTIVVSPCLHRPVTGGGTNAKDTILSPAPGSGETVAAPAC